MLVSATGGILWYVLEPGVASYQGGYTLALPMGATVDAKWSDRKSRKPPDASSRSDKLYCLDADRRASAIPQMRRQMSRHTDKEIEQAAPRFERLADSLDPATTAEVEGTDDLREVATAAETVRADDARLREAVLLARAHGRSWNHIALALGVSRQAARQRYADKASA